MPEKLLHLLQRHPTFSQGGGHGVAEERGIDTLVDASERRGLLHQLLDTPRGIVGVAPRFEEGSVLKVEMDCE
jgi:hypothetical protein